MAPSAFHGLFDFQPSSSASKTNPIAPPSATHQKTKTTARQAPSAIELDDIAFGSQYNGPSSEPPSGVQTPRGQQPKENRDVIEHVTPNELEMSRPPSPRDDAVEVVQRWNEPRVNLWRFASCCGIYFVNGIFDSGKF
jgi:hypothetical protein